MRSLILALVGVVALVRYRAMIPFVYLTLASEHVARHLIVQGYSVERSEPATAAHLITYGMLALVLIGLALSLIPTRNRASPNDGLVSRRRDH